MRRLEVDRQPLVDGAAVGAQKGQIGGVTRLHLLRLPAAYRGDHRPQVLAGQAHHADAAASGSGGDGCNRGCIDTHSDPVCR
jgi:hypothetical protein